MHIFRCPKLQKRDRGAKIVSELQAKDSTYLVHDLLYFIHIVFDHEEYRKALPSSQVVSIWLSWDLFPLLAPLWKPANTHRPDYHHPRQTSRVQRLEWTNLLVVTRVHGVLYHLQEWKGYGIHFRQSASAELEKCIAGLERLSAGGVGWRIEISRSVVIDMLACYGDQSCGIASETIRKQGTPTASARPAGSKDLLQIESEHSRKQISEQSRRDLV